MMNNAMTELTLTDNTRYSTKASSSVYIAAGHAKQLIAIANESIKELSAKHPNLLVWPQSIDQLKGKFDADRICEVIPHKHDAYEVRTGNIMGFLQAEGLQLKIKSRFDTGSDDYLLYYMLSRVFALNLVDLQHASAQSESILDLLPCLFASYLHKALQQGIFRQYRRLKCNDANVRGPIDLPRHIKCNVPFNGKVAYHKRVYDDDNAVTQLIRHTIEHIRTQPVFNAILNHNPDLVRDIQTIEQLTPSYRRNALREILQANERPIQHAYYTAYAPLQRLCLQILHREQHQYSSSKDDIYGILFDGAWLWEEYLNVLFNEQIELNHPQNKLKKNPVYLFEHNYKRRYPDFYNTKIVLDAKYKHLDNAEATKHEFNVQRNDLHQLISYMHCLKLSKGGFVFPSDKEVPTQTIPFMLNGYGGAIAIFGLKIPKQSKSFEDFISQISINEGIILDQLLNFID